MKHTIREIQPRDHQAAEHTIPACLREFGGGREGAADVRYAKALNGPLILPYTKERIEDVLDFEGRLREEEDFWGWEIDEAYIAAVRKSFRDPRFASSISLLAYVDGRVVGRIDSTLICSHFDGSVKAYLDWICVLQSQRHKGVAQALMTELRRRLKDAGADTLIGLIASNPEARRFYRSLEKAEIRDEGIWIDLRETAT
ncbi:MAG: GNAT family N-acetyltransferase [Oscillibacter sp.]|nr:GNAT family N-acetyltransferase [Oscillibacter sp.]